MLMNAVNWENAFEAAKNGAQIANQKMLDKKEFLFLARGMKSPDEAANFKINNLKFETTLVRFKNGENQSLAFFKPSVNDFKSTWFIL